MRPWMRAALLIAALAVSGQGHAQTPRANPLGASIAAIVEGTRLAGARLGVVVMDATTGRVLYEHDPDVPLNPASNAKVLTAAVALSRLGPQRRFSTGLYGSAERGVVQGEIVLRGEGDPSLALRDLYDMARELALSGVREVRGDVVVDDSFLGAQHLPPAFEQQPGETAVFRSAVSAVSLDRNAMVVRVAAGSDVGAPALVGVDPPGYVEVVNEVNTTDGGSPSLSVEVTPLADGRERVRVIGNHPLGAPVAVRARRVENPSLAAGHALRSMLAVAGVRVTGGVRVATTALSGRALLVRHESAPLATLLQRVGKESDNFYAEMTLLAIAAQPSRDEPAGEVTFERGSARMIDWARRAGVDTQGMVVRNGSGLFDANRFTARQAASVLRAAWRDPAIRDEYVAQLAVAGDEGTLRGRGRAAGTNGPRRVRAKTGTLRDVIALSGYALAPDPSRSVIFVVLCNGVAGHGAEARAMADRVAAAVADSLPRGP